MDPEEENEVSIMCAELVARDVYDLFRLFHDKLRWVVDNEAAAFDGADPAEVKKVLDRFKASYDDKYPRVRAFLGSTAELLSIYGVKLRTRLEEPHNWLEAGAAAGAGSEGAEGEEGEGDVAVEAGGADEPTVVEEGEGEEDEAPASAARRRGGRRAAPEEEDDEDDEE